MKQLLLLFTLLLIGCSQSDVGLSDDEVEKFFCPPESREADVCIEIYQPVCGWFDNYVNCLTYPCAKTFGSSCFACMDETVAYWTQGECPT